MTLPRIGRPDGYGCAQCEYVAEMEMGYDVRYECRRNPPSIGTEKWPSVAAHEWCGEWTPPTTVHVYASGES